MLLLLDIAATESLNRVFFFNVLSYMLYYFILCRCDFSAFSFIADFKRHFSCS